MHKWFLIFRLPCQREDWILSFSRLPTHLLILEIVPKATSEFLFKLSFSQVFRTILRSTQAVFETTFKVTGSYQKTRTSFILYFGILFGFSAQKDSKKSRKPPVLIQKVPFWFLGPKTNVHLVTLSLYGMAGSYKFNIRLYSVHGGNRILSRTYTIIAHLHSDTQLRLY